MKILIAYATNSGGTQMASNKLSDELKNLGHEVTVSDITGVTIDSFKDYGLVIMASPSWDVAGVEGMPHENIHAFMENNKQAKLEGQKMAIFGLGESSYDKFCGAVDHMMQFAKNTGTTIVSDPLKIDGYFYNQDTANQQLAEWAKKIVAQ